jgi:outer membrane immunogenic protein
MSHHLAEGLNMKSRMIQLGLAIAALLAAPLAAQAADLGPGPGPVYKAPAYVAPSFSWSGFYVGLNTGYGSGTSTWTGAVPVTLEPKGWLAGATFGYNIQTGSWVWGFEGDWDWSNQKASKACAGGNTCSFEDKWFATARGRFGYGGWNSFMPYLTAGVAAANERATNSGGGSDSTTRFGWVVGAGVEYALFSSWSVKLEYLYADLGKDTCTSCVPGPGSDQVSFKNSIVRAGINYRF